MRGKGSHELEICNRVPKPYLESLTLSLVLGVSPSYESAHLNVCFQNQLSQLLARGLNSGMTIPFRAGIGVASTLCDAIARLPCMLGGFRKSGSRLA